MGEKPDAGTQTSFQGAKRAGTEACPYDTMNRPGFRVSIGSN